jgi:hypothetical protein
MKVSSNTKSVGAGRHAKVLDAVLAGRLPAQAPERTWGGRGSGVPCAICTEPLRSDEVEWELEFTSGLDRLTRTNLHVHPDCYADWDLARHRTLPSTDGDISLRDREREARIEK